MAIDKAILDSARFKKAHASLVVLRGAQIGRDFRLRRRRTLVGRGPEVDIRVLDDLASREHASIEHEWDEGRKFGRYVLHDLGSTNGTLVNNRPAERISTAA